MNPVAIRSKYNLGVTVLDSGGLGSLPKGEPIFFYIHTIQFFFICTSINFHVPIQERQPNQILSMVTFFLCIDLRQIYLNIFMSS